MVHFWYFEESTSYISFFFNNYDNDQIMHYMVILLLLVHSINNIKHVISEKIHMKVWKFQCEMKRDKRIKIVTFLIF